MKKIISIILVALMLLSMMPVISVFAEDTEYCLNYDLNGINGERVATSVIIYTPDHGDTTGTTGNGSEYVVESDGRISAINKSDSPIPAEGYVLSVGPAIKGELQNVKIGDLVLFDESYNCVTVVSAGYSPFVSETISYDGINVVRSADKLIIYRGNATSETNTWGYEACVDADGTIISVGGNNNAIPEGGYVISGVGVKKPVVEAVCKLGYSAIFDEIAKTVTVSYTKENAVASFELRLKNAVEKCNTAYSTYADVDMDTAKASLQTLNDIYEKMQVALSGDNISEFMKLSNAFDKESEKFNVALIPYVPVETRALWLRIPTKNDKTTVENVVKEIYGMGFNSVCIEILFDSTTIMPVPEDSLFEQNPIFKGEDMLKLYTDEFHKYGIEVHAWMSCYRVGHDGSNNVKYSVAKKKPEWLNTDQNGDTTVVNEYGNAYFLNPALPEVREFLLETYKYILENYAIDGFQLDYVRYPENTTVNYGYDEYTVSEFTKKYGIEKAPTSSSQKGWSEWCEFRASFVTDLVESVGELIKDIRPDVLFSCDVAPDYATSKTKMCQDTEKWIKEGIVDVVYPMAYGTTDAVAKWTDITVELAGNDVQTVIGLRDNGPEIYLEQIIRARECNADGTAFFSYSQYVAGEYEEYIKSTVFSKPALCPSYNAKEAIIAQLNHIIETVATRMPLALQSVPQDIKDYADTLGDLTTKLKESDVESQKAEIDNALKAGYALADSYKDADNGVSEYLRSALRIIEKTSLNSRDAEKAAYKEALPDEEEAPQENSEPVSDEQPSKLNIFERIVQVIFIVVMSMGILGLPLYFWLNSRRKRIALEYDSNNDENDDDSVETNDTEKADQTEESDE